MKHLARLRLRSLDISDGVVVAGCHRFEGMVKLACHNGMSLGATGSAESMIIIIGILTTRSVPYPLNLQSVGAKLLSSQ